MFWWTRRVTVHYHVKEYMDRVGKAGEKATLVRKTIDRFDVWSGKICAYSYTLLIFVIMLLKCILFYNIDF